MRTFWAPTFRRPKGGKIQLRERLIEFLGGHLPRACEQVEMVDFHCIWLPGGEVRLFGCTAGRDCLCGGDHCSLEDCAGCTWALELYRRYQEVLSAKGP